jgi:ADP-heptose:LPS heptosyltransferase
VRRVYPSCTVIIVAGPSDHVVGDAVAHACRQPVLNASGEMSIAELSEILRRSALLISNDSGPVHVAVAVGTPVVDIFGRNQRGLSPKRWGPLGPHDQVLHKEVGCDRCLAHDCDIAFQCLTEISVAEVLSAARATMAAAQAVQVSTP